MKTAANYPTYRVIPTPNHIMWIFDGPFSTIDNFALIRVVVDVGCGMDEFMTSEHAYAAAKSANYGDYKAIRDAGDPGAAKSLGRRVPLRQDWEQVKFQTMWDILQAKFQQSGASREVLESTGARHIVEGNTWNDQIWGMTEAKAKGRYTGHWSGQNALGRMLMEIRCELFGVAIPT